MSSSRAVNTERIEALKKIKMTAHFFDAWKIYWDALLDDLRSSGYTAKVEDRRNMARLYIDAGLNPVKVAKSAGVSTSEIIDAEIHAARTAGSAFSDAVRGTVDAAAVLSVDVFSDGIPSLESLGIEPKELEISPLAGLLEAALEQSEYSGRSQPQLPGRKRPIILH